MQRDSDPWPSSRVLTELQRRGADRAGPPRALGRGRGTPLIFSQELRWHGLDLGLEFQRHRDGRGDWLCLTLPPWDALVTALAAEELLWELVDACAAACGARYGSLGDGEALEPQPVGAGSWDASISRHIGLLLPETAARTLRRELAAAYRVLPESDLTVVLR
jgi:hypothetical protein